MPATFSCSQPDESGSRLPSRSVSLSHCKSVRLAFVQRPLITFFCIYSKIFEYIFCRNFGKAWPNETVYPRIKQILVAMKESQFSESRFLESLYRPNGCAVLAKVVFCVSYRIQTKCICPCAHVSLRHDYTCCSPFTRIYLKLRLKIEGRM